MDVDQGQMQRFWTDYFLKEQSVYEKLLSNPDEVVEGTVKELAEKYGEVDCVETRHAGDATELAKKINGEIISADSMQIYKDMDIGTAKVTKEEAEEKFGFLLEAFKYGTPPHGGMGIGLDRLCMTMLGCDSIRDVTAFPKVATSSELMSGAPATVDQNQLDDLAIAINLPEDEYL